MSEQGGENRTDIVELEVVPASTNKAEEVTNNNDKTVEELQSATDKDCCDCCCDCCTHQCCNKTWIGNGFLAIVNIIKYAIYRTFPSFSDIGIGVNIGILILSIASYFTFRKSLYKYKVCRFLNPLWITIAVLALLFYLVCTCFSADSIVYAKKSADNNMIKMPLRDIEIGDHVLILNPWTNEVFWEEVLMKIHYSWYDNAHDYYSMRKIYLENNASITLSYDHFIFIQDVIMKQPKVIQSESVNIGDALYHYDHDTETSELLRVSEIEENVMSQKRVFFTIKPYLLVNDVVVSPYIGPHPIYHTILHKVFKNIVFIAYVLPLQYVLSLISLVGFFLIYGSYFIVMYWVELSIPIIVYGVIVQFQMRK